MDGKGYYLLLQVPEKASYLEIKKAYRKLAKKYHPDKNLSGKSDEKIKLINEAFEVLSDKEKRRKYDSGSYEDSIVDDQKQLLMMTTAVYLPLDQYQKGN